MNELVNSYFSSRTVLDERVALQKVVDDVFDSKETVNVLEAGCGSATHIKMGANAYVVGIDISRRQLERNESLNERILGDIQEYDLPSGGFDLIICWNVLEHLAHPRRALENFARAVRDGGMIILRLPNVLSVEGLMTKCTPHWFHVWVQRHLYGREIGGETGYKPFKTYMRMSLRPRALRLFAHGHGLIVRHCGVFARNRPHVLKNRHPVLYASYRLFALLASVVTFGVVDAGSSGCLAVFQKASLQQ
ncbi:MAG: class I SAM-dependent methyltransferase [Planctomycetota bacterium]|nr:class I SAM-dependent methyltransferase [Planctomycetota bacterium]